MGDKMPNDVDREQCIGIDLNCPEVPADSRAKALYFFDVFRLSEAIKFSGYPRRWQSRSIRLPYQILFVSLIFPSSSPLGWEMPSLKGWLCVAPRDS